jgi:hypothetical protein
MGRTWRGRGEERRFVWRAAEDPLAWWDLTELILGGEEAK